MNTKRYETARAKALRVLACCGKPPRALKRMPPKTIEALAAMCNVNGECVPGVQEKCRVLLYEHYESLKAVNADLE